MGNNGDTAFVRIDGQRIYLGKFGSTEAAQNYARCVAEWAVGCSASGPTNKPVVGTITVNSPAIAFLDDAKANDPSQ